MSEGEPDPDHVGQYTIREVIGSDTFATVYKAQHQVTLSFDALKTVTKSTLRTMREFELFQHEVSHMKMMDHPFVASLFEVLDDDKHFYLATELAENGNLLDYINQRKCLSEVTARLIYFQ
jgi:serine/threonine protein kinase